MYNNLYLGDSSDDEEFHIRDLVDSSATGENFHVSHFIKGFSQLLLKSAHNLYRAKKLVLREKVVNKLILDVDKNIISVYLKYKHSSEDHLKDTLNNYALEHTDYIQSKLNDIFRNLIAEKKGYNIILQTIVNTITSELVKFVYGEQYNHLIWQSIDEEWQTPLDFFNKVNIKPYLTSDGKKENIDDVFSSLLNAHREDRINSLTYSNSGKKKYFQKKYWEENIISFIKKIVQEYLLDLFSKKPLNLLYNDIVLLNIGIPEEIKENDGDVDLLRTILPFYNKLQGTGIAKARTDYIKNPDAQEDKFYQVVLWFEAINTENAKINRELIQHRPQEVFMSSFRNTLSDFLLEHRILRSKIKEQGIKEENRIITHNKKWFIDQTDEKTEIYHTGSRNDSRFLAKDDSYKTVSKYLINLGITGMELKNYIIQILHGDSTFAKNENISDDFKVYLCKFVDLLFNLETERNISAYITNILFFELLAVKEYQLKDLPLQLPMTIKGAVESSRFATENTPLKKSHQFDFKISEHSLLDFIRFDIRNCWLLYKFCKHKNIMVNDSVLIAIDNLELLVKLLNSELNESEKKAPKAITLLSNAIEKEVVGNLEHKEELNSELLKYLIEKKDNLTDLEDAVNKFIDNQYKEINQLLKSSEIYHSIKALLIDWYDVNIDPSESLLAQELQSLSLGNDSGLLE